MFQESGHSDRLIKLKFMEVQKQDYYQFYSIDPNTAKVSMSHFGILSILSREGYCRAQISDGAYVLVKNQNNRIKKANESHLINFLRDYLFNSSPGWDVMETFTKGIGSYINAKKIHLLSSIELESDMDNSTSSSFYFKNNIKVLGKDQIADKAYNELKGTIWENRIIPHQVGDNSNTVGQFETFCFKISGEDIPKFESLKSIIGYLLHRYKDPTVTKAIILYDSKMKSSGQAEGRTGKSLIAKAISRCREVVFYNGKSLKENSVFQNQRLELTTDLMVYDDVKKNFDFASVFPLITTNIEVEKKGRDAFEIPYERSPKLLITSNTYVKGPGGPSDRGRRCEFELANYYSEKFTPRDDFGNNFFDEWNEEEWDRFYYFMMECVQFFLNKGLIKGEENREREMRLLSFTSEAFIYIMKEFCPINEKQDQRLIVQLLNDGGEDITSHMFTKWANLYCDEMGLKFHQKNSGGVVSFTLLKN